MKPKINLVVTGLITASFRFDRRMEGFVMRDGSISCGISCQGAVVDVGISSDEDDSWESWDRTSHFDSSRIMNAVTKKDWSLYDTVFATRHYTITRQDMPPKVDRLIMIRNFHFHPQRMYHISFLFFLPANLSQHVMCTI